MSSRHSTTQPSTSTRSSKIVVDTASTSSDWGNDPNRVLSYERYGKYLVILSAKSESLISLRALLITYLGSTQPSPECCIDLAYMSDDKSVLFADREDSNNPAYRQLCEAILDAPMPGQSSRGAVPTSTWEAKN